MSDVRNQRLAHYVTSDANYHTVFSVPDMTVVLFKSARWHNSSANTAVVQTVLQSTAGPLTLEAQSIPAGAQLQWDGWIAMNPLDALVMYSDQVGVGLWCSGAVLAGGPPYPVMPTVNVHPLPAITGIRSTTPAVRRRS